MRTCSPLLALTLPGLVLGLASCSKSDSPTAPRPSPTPQAVSLSLTVSSSTAVVGEAVEARATVRQGGSAVPDGTVVSFALPRDLCFTDTNGNGQKDPGEEAPCHVFLENNQSEITKQTTGGMASAAWTSTKLGEVSITAAVGSSSASATVRFAGFSLAGKPVVYGVDPDRGSWQGGEEVTIRGEHLCVYVYTDTGQCDTSVPPEVTFEPPGGRAEVVAVAPDGRTLRVRTPRLSPSPPSGTTNSKVTVTNQSGFASWDGVFAYLPSPVEYAPAAAPVIYRVEPNHGSWQGGEEVTIYGINLCVYVSTATGLCQTSTLPTVQFTAASTPDAEVTWVSPDGRALRVKTPAVAVAPITDDTYTDVLVTNLNGTAQATRGFVYTVADNPAVTPVLYALSPDSGPIEGGTRVTIFGAGFQYPVQVLFGDRQAQVISSNFNQIVCIAPSIAPTDPNSPTTVNVSVVNVLTGKVSSNTLPYRYGEAMFVSAITPNTGYILGWNPATIYGQGFVAPVQVTVTVGSITKEAQVLSVSGTSIQVKLPPFAEAVGDQGCTPQTATVTVTNIGSNLSATAPVYTYLCSGGISGP